MAQARVKASELQRVDRIVKILEREYPDAKCSLDFKSPFELICATILSAQCTDVRVNLVTPELFKRFPTPEAMAKARLPELEKLIRTTGFFRAKAKSLKECATSIVEKHDGQVPRTMEELVHLRGVGRKTANVVLGNAFGLPGLPVDTHVTRVSHRLGLTKNKDAVKIEYDLHRYLKPEDWCQFSHLLIFHGRAICVARKPLCEECAIRAYCPRIGVAGAAKAG